MTRTDTHSPLAHSQLRVTITDLIAEYELRHHFRNTGPAAIEAVYSFPVPLDAAFMGMEATLGGEHLIAQIHPRAQASREYDDAITDGDSAVLLEWLEAGMLCVNLGNLKPGEEGEILLRFAAPLRCADGTARFSLPLVHRPRYGHSRLDELVEPQHDFAVEHPLDASIHVRGLLAHAPVSCASHAARFSSDTHGQSLQLNRAMLDRDMVLSFDLPADFSGQARLLRDGDRAMGVLSFNLPLDLQTSVPTDLCLVMDGSGSMTGDAIAQSRAALHAVAGVLSEADRIQVLRFGSSIVPLFRRPLKATTRVCEAMKELADTVDSDLGGTEMGAALDRAIEALIATEEAAGRNRAIILVTDGAVHPHNVKAAQERASQLGIAIFVVAVGSSAGSDVLEPLARATRGVLERAVPAEPIDAAVMRQMRRARSAHPVDIHIDWGHADAKPLPRGPAFAGDAVTAFAVLPLETTSRATVNLAHGRHRLSFDLAVLEDAPALRALAGHLAYRHAADEQKEALALRYGLVTDETSAVLVKIRAANDKVEGLPQIQPVAHMHPDGMMLGSVVPGTRHYAVAPGGAGYSVDSVLFSRRPLILADVSSGYSGVRVGEAGASGYAYRPELLRAVAGALIRLLLDDEAKMLRSNDVLRLLGPSLQREANRYLAEACPEGLDHAAAVELLHLLLDEFPDIVLSDEQEARLSLLPGSSGAGAFTDLVF